jgi:hypothetical protein
LHERKIMFIPDNPLERTPLHAPSQALPLDRGRASLAPPLSRGGWEGFEPNGLSGLRIIIIATLTLIAPITSSLTLAAEPAPVEAVPAEVVPAEAVPAPAMPATPPEKTTAPLPSSNTRPVNDNHVDYRYCLELKTNREIAECRYKKK